MFKYCQKLSIRRTLLRFYIDSLQFLEHSFSSCVETILVRITALRSRIRKMGHSGLFRKNVYRCFYSETFTPVLKKYRIQNHIRPLRGNNNNDFNKSFCRVLDHLLPRAHPHRVMQRKKEKKNTKISLKSR